MTSLIATTMECPVEIQCPFCGQTFELTVDTSLPRQQFTSDCEVCCRPLLINLECEPGEVLNVVIGGD